MFLNLHTEKAPEKTGVAPDELEDQLKGKQEDASDAARLIVFASSRRRRTHFLNRASIKGLWRNRKERPP